MYVYYPKESIDLTQIIEDDVNKIGVNFYESSRDGYYRYICHCDNSSQLVDCMFYPTMAMYSRSFKDPKIGCWIDSDIGHCIITVNNCFVSDILIRYEPKQSLSRKISKDIDWSIIKSLGVEAQVHDKDK